MKVFRKIDNNGYFVEDVVLEPTIRSITSTVLGGNTNDADVYDVVSLPEYNITANLIEDEIPQGFLKPQWDAITKTWVDADEAQRLINEIEFVKIKRFAVLERVFNDKAAGLKKIAIDKPYMIDAETINSQYNVYEEMYKNALAGVYSEVVNAEIIAANEGAKAQLAEVTLLLNSVRSVLENAILTEAENVDILLEQADAISLTKEELTPEKVAEIMTMFGL